MTIDDYDVTMCYFLMEYKNDLNVIYYYYLHITLFIGTRYYITILVLYLLSVVLMNCYGIVTSTWFHKHTHCNNCLCWETHNMAITNSAMYQVTNII